VLTAMLAFAWAVGANWVVWPLWGAGLAGGLVGGVYSTSRRVLIYGPLLAAPLVVVYAPGGFDSNLWFPGGTGFVYGGGVWLMLVCIFLLFRRNEPSELYLLADAALLLLLLAGARNRQEALTVPYVPLVVAAGAFLALFLRSRLPSARPLSAGAALAFLACLVLAGGFAVFLAWSETQVTMLLRLTQVSGAGPLAGPSRLNSLLEAQTSNQVAARVFSDRPPSRLVADRLIFFVHNQWTPPGERRDLRLRQEPPGGPWFTALEPPTGWKPRQVDSLELVLAREPLLQPPDGVLTATGLTAMQADPCAVLYLPAGVHFDGRYRVARGEVPRASEDPALLEACLKVAPRYLEVVEPLARQITRGLASPQDKARALESYLQDNFTYGFGYPFSTDNPLREFLEKRPPAHCEFFATALTLMLRSQGIPARYVRGFLVGDTNRYGGYAVARVRDAHAWVEAWLPGQGWTSFDPTPPGAIAPDPSPAWRQMVDYLFHLLGVFWAWVASGAALGWLARPLVLGPLALLAVLALALRRRGRPTPAPTRPVPAQVRRLQALLDRFDRALDGERPRHLTLLEFSRGLEGPARDFLCRYSQARYGRDLPDSADLEDLERRLEEVERARKSARR
jgi:transglutaminase-like putative cysteine protease